jgi:uracil-DNA glycosylase family 4
MNAAKRRKKTNQVTLNKLWAPPPPPKPVSEFKPLELPKAGNQQTGLLGYFGNAKKTELVSETKIELSKKRIRDANSKTKRLKIGHNDMNLHNATTTEENFLQPLSAEEIEFRENALEKLGKKYAEQNRITASRVLFGNGVVGAQIMVIRKQPSQQDQEKNTSCYSLKALLDSVAQKKHIDLSKYTYWTNLVKVRKGNKPINYQDVEANLPFLREQISLIQPKVIIGIGNEVATILKQHLMLEENNKGRDLWDGNTLFRGENVYTLHKNYQHITTVSIPECNYLGRIHLLQDPADFKIDYREKAEASFLQDIEHALEAVYFPKLKPQSPEEEFRQSLLSKGHDSFDSYARSLNVTLSKPTDLFFDRARLYDIPRPNCYISDVKEKNVPFKFMIQNLRYDEWSNQYYLFGRTEEGFLVCVHARMPIFRMWIKHKSFNPQSNQNRQVNFRLPDIDELYEHVINLLHVDLVKPYGKYNSLSREDFCNQIGLKFSWAWKRPFRKIHFYRKRYLQIDFCENDVKDKVHNIVEAYLKCTQSAEKKLTPQERFYYETDTYSQGWIHVDNTKVRAIQNKHTICDYEFEVEIKDIQGKNPFEEQHSKLAKFVVMDFDLEMKGQTGRFPVSQQDPIVRIGALIQEYGDPLRPLKLEYLRNPKDPSAVFATGRSNCLEKAMFVLGVHEELKGRKFSQTVLPYVPKIPEFAPQPHENLATELGQQYFGEWNAFISSMAEWVARVGTIRAKATLKSRILCEYFVEPGENPLLKSLSKDNATVRDNYQLWKNALAVVRDYWHNIIPLEQFDAFQLDYPNADERTIGTIEYNWHIFNPKPKTFFFRNEKELLVGFCEYVRQVGVDLVRGHNIAMFDIPYLQQRIQVLNLKQTQYFNDRVPAKISMGRCNFNCNYAIPSLKTDTCSEKIMITKASSEVRYVIPDIPGVDYLDTLTWARKEIGGLKYHTLSYIAKKVVKDRKFDVPGSSISHLFTTDPYRLSDYCDQDVELTCRITNAHNAIAFTVLCSRIIGAIQIYELYTTGVQRMIHNILMRFLRKEGLEKIVFDENPFSGEREIEEEFDEGDEIEVDGTTAKKRKRGEKGYKGATCIPPLVGLLIKIWICWDFSSLYPTIMIAHGLSIDLMGTLSRFKKLGISMDRLWTSGEKCPNYKTGQDEEWYFLQKRKLTEKEASELPAYDDQKAGLAQCVKNPDGTYTPKIEIGALVGILIFILAQRASVNARRGAFLSTSIEYAVLDCQQLGLKKIANSTYGFTGCKFGKYAAKQVGSSVTFVGRKTLGMVCDKMDAVRPGELGGGDTDSIFRSDDEIDELDKIFRPCWMPKFLEDPTSELVEKPWAYHIQDYLNRFVPPPMKIVIEKMFLPMFMIAKKRGLVGVVMPYRNKFTGKMTFESVKPKFSVKGVETTRRDQMPITQRILEQFLKMLMITKESERESAIKAAVEYVAKEIDRLHAGNYDIYELVETRYHGKSSPKQHTAMVELCDRKRRRGDPTPDLGTRQAFIVIQGDPKEGVNKRVEDPVYAIEHQLQPDIHYVTQKICKPIMRFAKHLGDPEKLRKFMFPKLIKKKKHSKIQSDNPLLSGMYVKKKCAFCLADSDRDNLCKNCKALPSATINETLLSKKRKLEVAFEQSASACYPCLGIEPGDKIECSNFTCKKYFNRVIANTTLEQFKTLEVEILNQL